MCCRVRWRRSGRLKAIRESNSPSRVMITSRYQFPAPAGTTIRVEPLETLSDVEQA